MFREIQFVLPLFSESDKSPMHSSMSGKKISGSDRVTAADSDRALSNSNSLRIAHHPLMISARALGELELVHELDVCHIVRT
jgi:hypothetical protein